MGDHTVKRMSTTPLDPRLSEEPDGRAPRRYPRPSPRWLWWLPVALGGAYALDLLVHLGAILHNIWLSSDSDIDAVLAHMSLHAPAGALLTTGDYPHYETIGFALLTRSWPLYRQIWVLSPLLFALAGFAALLWATQRSFGRRPTALVAAAAVCLSGGGVATVNAGGLATVLAMDAHANSLITATVVGAALVWVVPRVDRISGLRLLLAALALGLIGGLPLAGDNLYLAWGVAPLVAVTLLAAWRGPQDGAGRLLAFGLGTLLATIVTSVLFGALMHSEGVRGFSPSYHEFLTFATPSGLLTNFETLLRALPSLTAGPFYGKPAGVRSDLQLLSAMLVFASLAGVVWSVRRRVANALPRAAGGGDAVGERFVHTTFWTTALAAGIFVFLIGSPNPYTTDGRYLLGPYFAIIALLPLMLERGLGWKLIVAAGVSLFAASALYQLSGGIQEMAKGYETAGVARRVAAYAQREHVAVGYGDYWNSIDLMWESDFRVEVFPIQRCATNGRRLCNFSEISISGWDRPHGNVRSMLVVNPAAAQVRAREAAFGRPLASTRVGNLLLYVYPYDIATRLGHESGLTL